MKKLIYVLFTIFVGVSIAWGASATFQWDANTESDLAGYRIHWGTATREYTEAVDVKNVTSFQVENLPDGKLFFAATAYDTAGNESDYSDEVVVTFNTVPPGAPLNFKVTITDAKTVTIEVE